VSAYSTAIRLTGNKYMDAFLNRSAAHLRLGNFQRCAEDCSVAYELLTPRVPSNLKARKQCLARRGAALCKLGYLKEGYAEFLEAVKLDPNDQALKEDAEMVRKQLECEN
jgi:dyslexia susceptibility 1 candidate gene 1 protein